MPRHRHKIKKYLSILTFCVPPISKIIIIIARRLVALDRPNSQEVAPRSASIDIVQKKRKEKMKKTVKRERILYFFVDSQHF